MFLTNPPVAPTASGRNLKTLNPNLSLKDLTGQMLVAGFEGTHLNLELEKLIVDRRVGGLILFERNFVNPEQLTRLVSELQSLAMLCPAKVPLFISVDQEGGRVSRLKAPFSAFPQPGCLGKARSEPLARRFGLALGREMQAVGINMVYAPVLDVNTNPANPIIGTRALSENPEWAARLGKAVIDGICEVGVLPVGKHFPGHGDTDRDSHLELPYVDRDIDSLEKIELEPFSEAVKHGLEVIMTAHVIYSAWDSKLPATFSPRIMKNILRDKLGFSGLVMTDDLEMKAIEKHIPFDSIPRLGTAAEVDLYLICHDRNKILSLQDQMIRDVEEGHIDKESIERSVRRVTDVKKRMAISPRGEKNLAELAHAHLELIGEMNSYLP
ncbi:MAG TPA: beta-N-acetylhexosaminidase [Nitrospinaceae bacterium]|jgi:beta-N-acetylhexosaminidase|nr:beta-N-acetylhexosaminidase [Nitrospinota bacterium]MDP6335174.1 beta-N-acetylhexosaminidase [Nitrospinaceae bacterium]HAX45808.1 beta-N-acetylhexosaminidase [Nitrospina sp.]MDP7147568.1 beta-N-acetylhexosaminidase [Nitrospinaceae bacterium]MDP7611790.1 beta-N-acetylhexosaminidase [Nitrospinaceae bacterium]|tara:strand:- start:917 stop:2065 length:1149 start_codon:yes stop_codon:yes gene_type:complete